MGNPTYIIRFKKLYYTVKARSEKLALEKLRECVPDLKEKLCFITVAQIIIED